MALTDAEIARIKSPHIAAYEKSLQAQPAADWSETLADVLADETVVLVTDDKADETFISANRLDSKGREIGFIVATRTVAGKFYGWCQNARRVGGRAKDFGASQPSKEFPDLACAKAWARRAAAERIAKLA